MNLRLEPAPAGVVQAIRVLRAVEIPVPMEEFVRGVDEFVEGVMQRLTDSGCRVAELEASWRELGEERQDVTVTLWRKLEALLGKDPGTGAEEEIRGLLLQEPVIGASALAEVAAAVPDRPSSVLRAV